MKILVEVELPRNVTLGDGMTTEVLRAMQQACADYTGSTLQPHVRPSVLDMLNRVTICDEPAPSNLVDAADLYDRTWAHVKFVYDKFKSDLDAGYKTNDKVFAVDLLGKALEAAPATTCRAMPPIANTGSLDEVKPAVDSWIQQRGTNMDGESYVAALQLAAFIKESEWAAAAPTPIADSGASDDMTCPNCNGIGTTAGATYTYCSMCNKTGKVSIKRPEQRAEVFKRNWFARYGFAPTETDFYNAGMLFERSTAQPVSVDAVPVATDHQIQDWADRHGINIHGSDLRCAFEDAATWEQA